MRAIPAGEEYLGRTPSLSSLEDTMEDSNGYWRFDIGGTGEVSYSVTILHKLLENLH
jgi:predicted secreted protein